VLKNKVKDLNNEIDAMKAEGKQWAEHFAHKSDNRDKAWQTIQQRLQDAEKEKEELDLHRRSLTRDIDIKTEHLHKLEKKAEENMKAATLREEAALKVFASSMPNHLIIIILS